MKFAPLSLLSLLTGLFILPLNARDYYILFDGNCMDRLSYVHETGSYSDTSMVVHINLGQGEKVILEMGRAAANTLDYVPSGFISCGNGQFGEPWVNALRKGSDRYFLVWKQDARSYAVFPVVQASFFRLRDWVIGYSSQYYRFEFNLLDGIIGENIATVNQEAEVYFEGRIENDCSGGFIFRQFSKVPGVPQHIDILLSPEIGILEERSGKNAEDAFNRVKRLIAINGKSPDTYLKVLCGVLPAEPVVPETGSKTPPSGEMFTPKGIDTPAKQLTHTVAQGENLFAIAQRYKIPMDDLVKWNNLRDAALIFPGDKLSLFPPDAIPADGPAPYDITIGRPSVKPGIIEDDVIVFGTTPAQPGTFSNKGLPVGQDAAVLHTVVAGETVASIAYKYGYTEWKFREFNNLSKDAFVRIGQQLKTSHCVCPPTGAAEVPPTAYDMPESRFDFQSKGVDPYASKVSTPVNRNTATFYDVTPKGVPTPYDTRPAGTRKFHIVLEGETLFGIARRYQITIEELRAINQLEKNEIVVPAQKIYLEP
ncbi:MAG: LysM peptidoglycan-binding domain-containing protein [Saprospiraceae bacterium]|jgi:LysM repeat protein|nr:LysM peptidoglycan-binding domain-containing protein [Saprospiraceae bacterium]MDP4998271.1 LysM peptidoglycan-binding domain-containing protein [Saprospiraceae bacterium]